MLPDWLDSGLQYLFHAFFAAALPEHINSTLIVNKLLQLDK